MTDDPTVRDNTYRVIEDSLTRLEQHVRGQATSGPVAAQPARIFVIRLKNDVGEVVLEGPPENQAAMVEDAHRLLELMREQAPDDE